MNTPDRAHGSDDSARSDLAARLTRACRLTGHFRQRSGTTSDHFFDEYQFQADPDLLTEVADELIALLPPQIEVVAGLDMGGIALATIVAVRLGLPLCFVRKHAQAHGTGRLVEGADPTGRSVIVVDPVVQTGGQMATGLQAVAAAGARMVTGVCVIDRSAGHHPELDAIGAPLVALFKSEDLPVLPVR